jgi:multiple sugar transport system ATP-binding protein
MILDGRHARFDTHLRLGYKHAARRNGAFIVAKVILEGVSKIYPGNVVGVDDVNLEINDREFVVLVGPSGCGKSTTLRMIAGLEEISKGSIFIDGKRVNDVPPKDRDIAMVFQNYALYPHMTVYKNMAFGLMLRKFPKAEIDQRVREAAQILGITDEQLQRKPRALSGGQRQRVAVGRAIVRKPKAFLFDEPLSNLDAKMRVAMRAEISKLHDRLNSTMIYVTHDQVEAMTMGDRIVVMKDGKIEQVADPIALYDNPQTMFVAGFIGSPPMNFFHGTLEMRGAALWFVESDSDSSSSSSKASPAADVAPFALRVDDGKLKALTPYLGKPVVFGLRPENINDKRLALNPNPEQTVAAVVDVMEPMGAETFLYLRTTRHNFIARVDSHENVKVGERLEAVFDVRKSHFFDPKTERVIV